MKQLHWLTFSILILVSLTACTPPSVLKPERGTPTLDSEEAQAQDLYENGLFDEAAPLLEILALRQGPTTYDWQLKAADAYMQSGNRAKASQLLQDISVALLDNNQSLFKRLLQAQLYLLDFRPDDALTELYAPPAEDTDSQLQQRYYRQLAEAYRINGNLIESANALQDLDRLLLDDPGQRLQNQLAIIRTLATLTDDALTMLQPSPPGIQGGWMELARLIKLHGQEPATIQDKVSGWRSQFASHPAMVGLLDGYFQQMQEQYQQASHIAILLPQKGRYKAAANAIRKGLLAAWYQQPAASRPLLRFYDSSNADQAWPLYVEAISRGADFVIGPLQKSAVTQILHAGELETPVLALNQVQTDITPPDNFYQFSLSPEDEARQVAERAWIDGYRQPVVLTPGNSWGKRIFNAFRERWEALGGQITENQFYNAKDHDFGAPIQAMLDIDQSKNRRKKIQRLIGERVEFEPRRREDTDFIFVAAQPQKARQIRPQLQFHHALNMPIYTTSHAWSGHIEENRDRDIEGIFFPDIPWLLADEGMTPLSNDRLEKALNMGKSRYIRLVAMGIDSYQLLGHLTRLQNAVYETHDGKTGQLYMDPLKMIRRQLIWAKMRNSKPQVIGYAPRLEPQNRQNALEQAPIETIMETQTRPIDDNGAPVTSVQ